LWREAIDAAATTDACRNKHIGSLLGIELTEMLGTRSDGAPRDRGRTEVPDL